mmetsp:Transcript_962/g.3317  ORF Transcript_962/g.3317 Transcript_962/m.3317 type:complete len:1116 (-) Transcript_962:3492-6839(-)|eukprot:CAMPEP_0117447110 /NCGR_PEP_ID=MMETSP0759-20121206/6698_1 /TAXON_ID=63605 /ORGANISM="Percolomonas cosmopolitus, Strain WS" /LENGTH=1115 /DNA_ID=CAMNT_0005239419 /DNA_START=370 /DNA_END=3717 /DNA_ORIENTATION=-
MVVSLLTRRSKSKKTKSAPNTPVNENVAAATAASVILHNAQSKTLEGGASTNGQSQNNGKDDSSQKASSGATRDRSSSSDSAKSSPPPLPPRTNRTKSMIQACGKLSTIEPRIGSVQTKSSLVSQNETPSGATTLSMQKSIDMLIGAARDWCSDSSEVQQFRENMKKSRRDWTKFVYQRDGGATSNTTSDNETNYVPTTFRPCPTSLPEPRYFGLPDPYLIPQWQRDALSETASFICCVHVKEINMRKAVKCLFLEDTNHFIADFIQKTNERHKLDLDPEDVVLRASGSFEFLYGNRPIGHFEYIHKTLRKASMVNLYLVTKQSILANHKPMWLDYDYQYTQAESLVSLSHHHMRTRTDTESGREWYDMEHISMWDLRRPFSVRIVGVDNIPLTELFQQKFVTEDCALYVVVKILHGGNSLSQKRFSRCVPYSTAPRFNQWLCFDDLHICDLPKESKICFTLYCKPYSKNDPMLRSLNGEGTVGPKDYPVAMIASTVIDHKGLLRSGIHSPKMWLDEKGSALSSTSENVSADLSVPDTTLSFEFEQYALPVAFPTGEPPHFLKEQLELYEERHMDDFGDPSESTRLDDEIALLLSKDPLYKLTEKQKWIMWYARKSIQSNPKALSKFMLSVPWQQPYAVYEAHSLLSEWAPLEPIDALELLDYNFGDSKVRQYALSRLDELDDSELANFLLQLVQTLKFELGHDSSLARFLLQRGSRNPHLIGHIVFWHLVSEMHVPSIRERHGIILDEYLRNCGTYHLEQLLLQHRVLQDLNSIAVKVKKYKFEKTQFLREQLREVVPSWPSKFRLPLDPRMEVSGVVVEKCKVMDSKKLPLWIVFGNSDPTASGVYVIYKAGDDLRQDLLTLQMLKIMDSIWKRENLDLHIKPYGCVCTGDETGMIEVVLNSDTIANITNAQGGASAAFSETPLEKWLRKWNSTPTQWEQCQENFMFSSAGYCVATYVLGVGDRHNDNIMLQRTGDLFHIDFGHFLNHRKYLAGFIARETAPFIFTKMYAKVLGKKNSDMFHKFLDNGAKAYNILRKNTSTIMMLFILMLSTGIAELQSAKDVEWLRTCLKPEKTDEEAAQHWRKLVTKALSNLRAQINDAAHISVHSLGGNP